VRYIISINRTQGVEAARENLELAVQARKESNIVVGLELSGDPRSGSFADIKPVLEEARTEHGLKITLHCAESEEQSGAEAQDMIEFKPDRLGHCCYLTDEQI
jgi:adenosine deaminase